MIYAIKLIVINSYYNPLHMAAKMKIKHKLE